jgi:hypothetical protein
MALSAYESPVFIKPWSLIKTKTDMDISNRNNVMVASFFILRFATIKFLSKIQNKYDYSKYRMRPILKFIKSFYNTHHYNNSDLGVEQTKLLTLLLCSRSYWHSIICPMVYSFKHIFSTNHFISHPVKLGESITIIDKEFDITGRVSDIGYSM